MGTLTLIYYFFLPHYLQEMEEERIPEVFTRLQEQVKGTQVQGQVDLEQNDTGAW